MPKICFPATNRVHLARQKLLIDKLDVDVFTPTTQASSMATRAIMCAVEFNNHLLENEYGAVLIRGDRYEMLPMAAVAVYQGIPVIHLEGGDLSGVVDNKVRYAITHLSDYHFCTNEEAHQRLISNGVSPDRVWNFGSLDVEFALSVPSERIREGSYSVVLYHPIPGENEEEVRKATEGFVVVGSNSDYQRKYEGEEYSPDDFINLLRYADVCVGNSSALIKEASVLGVPVVLVGDRQHKRLLPKNVLQVPCESEAIKDAIEYQKKRKFDPDMTYYKPETSQNISETIKKFIKINEKTNLYN